MKQFRSILELVLTVVVAAGLAFLIQAFVVKPYRIPSGSMEPTLAINQRILVNRLDTKPGLGDVVVFHPPVGAQGSGTCGNPTQGMTGEVNPLSAPCDKPVAGESKEVFVKRIVGLPGDRLKITDGHVIRNGKREKDSYISTSLCPGSGECTFSETIVVPPGDDYMMGDNRGNSEDSRFWGPLPQKYIIGEAFFTYWPIGRIGVL
jgi:signal peptidase I